MLIHRSFQCVLLSMCLVLCTVLIPDSHRVWGQTAYQQGVSLHSVKPTLLDGFGFAVAVEGDSILVGAPHTAGTRGQVGQALLFQRETGKVIHTFSPPSPVGDDLFGLSVDLTERFVIVGAPRGEGKFGYGSGVVGVFDRQTGKLVRDIMSPNKTASVFGHAIATHGPWLAISDPGAGLATQFDRGEVYLFEIETGKLLRTFVSPDRQAGVADGFGHALAFMGSLLAIGAPLAGNDPLDHGKVYIFDSQSGKLMRTLTASYPQSKEYFGLSLASDQESLLVGALGRRIGNNDEAGAAYLFNDAGMVETIFDAPNPQKGGHFGEAVALMDNYFAVGSPGDDAAGVDAGTIFIFDKQTRRLQFIIPNPSTTTGAADLFGLSMKGKNNLLVVGSPYGDLVEMPDAGTVHQFHFDQPSSTR